MRFLSSGPRTGLPTALFLLLLCCSACGSDNAGADSSGAGAPAGSSDIPDFARWETQMKSYGETNCQRLRNKSLSYDDRLSDTYYDAEWVFYRIADYTGDSSWKSCALAAQSVYRDEYLFPNSGKMPGYWNFSTGLAENFIRTGDKRSKEAVLMLSRDAAFARDETALSETENADLSREVAYLILTYLNAEKVGEPRRARLTDLVNQALGHMDQWFVKRNTPYVRPFMAGLTAYSLIAYNEKTPDARIMPALIRAADWLWDHTWIPASEAFMYTDRKVQSGGQEPAPDLNMLVAPMYGWLYKQTGQQKFRERGDQIFAGGVKFAYLNRGKQFNQNYRLSFDYVKWRGSR